MATEWRALAPYVAPEVPGCPMPAILGALREAAREFCRDTHAWRETVTLEGEGAEYALVAPAEAVIIAVATVTVAGRPVHHTVRLPDAVSFPFTPQGEVAATLVLMPAALAAGLPADLADHWAEAIGHGAKGRLLAQPGKAWTNGAAAEDSRIQFRRAKGEAKARRAMGDSEGALTAQFPPLT